MTVTLQSIRRAGIEGDGRVLLVELSIDSQPFTFTLTIRPGGIIYDGKKLQVTEGGKQFNDTFRFGPRMAVKISRLLSDWEQGRVLDLPLAIGEMDEPKHNAREGRV